MNFTLTVSNSKFYYDTSYNPLPFSINSQYLEVGIVIVLMLVMIVFVRAPNRDEFYIDVPSLPEEKKIPIILKASDIVGIFDKLNTSYHWRYMPLSKAEIRSAIYSNLKYNNIPVGLTYSNIERMLDQLEQALQDGFLNARPRRATVRIVDAERQTFGRVRRVGETVRERHPMAHARVQ